MQSTTGNKQQGWLHFRGTWPLALESRHRCSVTSGLLPDELGLARWLTWEVAPGLHCDRNVEIILEHREIRISVNQDEWALVSMSLVCICV